MSVLSTYLELGFHHIVSPQATDHVAFLLALCAPYAVADWRRLLALVSSFTLGHSLTLALGATGALAFGPAWVEALIPLTVAVTAVLNLNRAGQPPQPAAPVLWAAPNALAVGFGLIHGLGFSAYLRQLLGAPTRPVVELLGFNLGVEVGQLLVVSVVLGAGVLAQRAGASRRDWVLTASGAALGIAAVLLVQQMLG